MRVRNRFLGFVFQFHHLLPEFSAVENVMMPGLVGGVGHSEMRGRATRLLEEVGLKERADENTHRFADALQAASAGAYQAVLKPVEGTMLTVLRDTSDAVSQAVSDGVEFHEILRLAVDAAQESVRRTPELLPVLAEAGVVDAGGRQARVAEALLGGQDLVGGLGLDAEVVQVVEVAVGPGGAGDLEALGHDLPGRHDREYANKKAEADRRFIINDEFVHDS